MQAALDTEAATAVTRSTSAGMMTELEGMNTANMLKVHVAAEPVASGRTIVDGLVTGPVHRFAGPAPGGRRPHGRPRGRGSGGSEGSTASSTATPPHRRHRRRPRGRHELAAIVARELSIPMISSADLPMRLRRVDCYTRLRARRRLRGVRWTRGHLRQGARLLTAVESV